MEFRYLPRAVGSPVVFLALANERTSERVYLLPTFRWIEATVVGSDAPPRRTQLNSASTCVDRTITRGFHRRGRVIELQADSCELTRLVN